MRPSSTLSFRLHALVYSIDSLASEVLKKHADISFPQFLVILCAYETPGHTQKFASEWLQITEATVSYMVKNLVQGAYLEVRLDTKDARTKKIYATRRGCNTIKKLYPLLEEALEPHFNKLTQEKLLVMSKNLTVIHNSIKESKKES